MNSRFHHADLGDCELLRVEGVDWIIKSVSTQLIHRIPPHRRSEFSPIDAPTRNTRDSDFTMQDDRAGRRESRSSLWAFFSKLWANPGPEKNEQVRKISTSELEIHLSEESKVIETSLPDVAPLKLAPVSNEQALRLRRVFESLRNGLSPINTEIRPYAIGAERLIEHSRLFLNEVKVGGGSATVVRGQYGQGKTFGLQLLRELALEAGFAVMSAEVDSFENRLDRPSTIYRSLLNSLTFPYETQIGPISLIKLTSNQLALRIQKHLSGASYSDVANRILGAELECKALAWILSDPDLLEKPNLIALLAGEPGIALGQARKIHVRPGEARLWPAFSAGSQGDFASYLLSGLGRLTRFLGYSGLVIILDEMEKWQDLNWQAQSRAGNLIGGLIWSSSAAVGSRYCYRNDPKSHWSDNCDHSEALTHSNRSGGFPFTTLRRCSLGLAIAMTPRGESGPEETWKNFGKLTFYDLPRFTSQGFKTYLERLYPEYQIAYGLRAELTASVAEKALTAWRQSGDTSARTAVQSALEFLDGFRDSQR